MAKMIPINDIFEDLQSRLDKDPALSNEIESISSIIEKIEAKGDIKRIRHPYVDAKPISGTVWAET